MTVLIGFVGVQESLGYGGGGKPDPRVCGDRLCSEIQDKVMKEIQKSFTVCIKDEDWPDKPCYEIQGEFFTMYEKRADWLEYYQYKGEKWIGENLKK